MLHENPPPIFASSEFCMKLTPLLATFSGGEMTNILDSVTFGRTCMNLEVFVKEPVITNTIASQLHCVNLHWAPKGGRSGLTVLLYRFP